MTKINGNTLISWGLRPGQYFSEAIKLADRMDKDNHFGKANYSEADIKAAVMKLVPVEPEKIALQKLGDIPIHYNIDAVTEYEIQNLNGVKKHVEEIAKIPVVKAISVMPDACVSGFELGTIPVGVVAVAENAIVPGFHSSDVCCSVAMSVFPEDTDPIALLDAATKLCHFGEGARPYSYDIQLSDDLREEFERNPYLSNKGEMAQKFLGSTGSSNHFVSVNRLRSNGRIALISHYGSRKPGAMLYDVGVETAHKYTKKACPEVPKHNSWIPYDSQEGQDYWEALQIMRKWTKKNHFLVHDMLAKHQKLKVKDHVFNEHNFVFKRELNGKNYFFHAKGSTPNYSGFASDTLGTTLIPLNMTSPILICNTNTDVDYGMNFLKDKSLGFAPHGAGRLMSRTQFRKSMIEQGISESKLISEVLKTVDARAYKGKHDVSEFPGAYKNAEEVIKQIEKYDLTKIVDYADAIGNIMVGTDGIDYKVLKRKKKERNEYNKG